MESLSGQKEKEKMKERKEERKKHIKTPPGDDVCRQSLIENLIDCTCVHVHVGQTQKRHTKVTLKTHAKETCKRFKSDLQNLQKEHSG